MKIKWIDINKGDENNSEVRCRMVGKEFNLGEKRLDLFAPTPPLEIFKILFSLAVTEGIGYKRGRKHLGKKIDVIDISNAFFHADALREVYVELPPEDYEENMCALLLKSLYGTRDAAQNWANAYMEFMEK